MRQAFIKQGAPTEALDILLDSLSHNTFKQYQSALKDWFKYCKERDLDCYNVSVNTILKFLTMIVNKGSKYGTLNCYRSALALVLGNKLEDNLISRFLKGVFKRSPALPKYDFTWDPSVVLRKLENLYPNDTISLEALSKKLVMLLALVTAHRAQTLSLIKLSNIEIYESRILIRIPDIIKTSNVNRSQPILVLPYFTEKPAICPAKTLNDYMRRTEILRTNESEVLFISYRKPHSRVTSQTLSRWIKRTLEESGVDTQRFSAHSTRHAATSAARRRGVNLQLIRSTAGWTGSSRVFATFYNRPLVESTLDGDFARSIID